MLQLVAQDFDGCAPLSCIHVFLGNSVAILWIVRFVKVQNLSDHLQNLEEMWTDIFGQNNMIFLGKTEVKREIHWKFEAKKRAAEPATFWKTLWDLAAPFS